MSFDSYSVSIGCYLFLYYIANRLLFENLCSVIGYTLLLSLIEYKTLVMRDDLERANQILSSIPRDQLNRYIFM